MDTRGTPWRDRAWQRAFYRHYGDLPVDGHADAIAALARRYPEMDATRVGIYGWSNGGYVAAMAILRRPEVFKVAVSGAPVADPWRRITTRHGAVLRPPRTAEWDQASLRPGPPRPRPPTAPARPLLPSTAPPTTTSISRTR